MNAEFISSRAGYFPKLTQGGLEIRRIFIVVNLGLNQQNQNAMEIGLPLKAWRHLSEWELLALNHYLANIDDTEKITHNILIHCVVF